MTRTEFNAKWAFSPLIIQMVTGDFSPVSTEYMDRLNHSVFSAVQHLPDADCVHVDVTAAMRSYINSGN